MDTRRTELNKLENLLPKGEYYGKTSKNFKANLEISSKYCAQYLASLQDQTQILSETMLTRWEKLLETKGKEETLASLCWQGGNTLAYITKKAKEFDLKIEVEIQDVYVVSIKNVTYKPILHGTFFPEIAREVRFLQRIKPAYMLFEYYDDRGVRVYSGI